MLVLLVLVLFIIIIIIIIIIISCRHFFCLPSHNKWPKANRTISLHFQHFPQYPYSSQQCSLLHHKSAVYVIPTTMSKIFETSASFLVKQGTTGKVQFLFSRSFLLVPTKFSFWEQDWALAYNFMKFWDFSDISQDLALTRRAEAIVLCPFLSHLWYTFAFFV